MRIGIFGGSFNPIHKAHVAIARYVLDKMKLDKIIIVPVGIPSHKNIKMADTNLRIKMCKEAFKDDANIVVSNIEAKSNEISYTIDTLKKLISLYGSCNEFYEIIGEDSANTLNTWKNYEEILKLSKIIVFRRFNYSQILPHRNMIYLDTPLFKISSTMIREKIKANEDVSSYLPSGVLNIIQNNNLYKD